MIAPRLEIDLEKIQFNARTLVSRLAPKGISVTAVMKATLGSSEVANTLLSAGIKTLGDARIENITRMRQGGIRAPMALIRSPMSSQAARVVKYTELSFNTEIDVIRLLSDAAKKAKRIHGIVLMVELGDLREGILPNDVMQTVQAILHLPNIAIKGIGTNLACRSGVVPDAENMARLSALANAIESFFGFQLEVVSGGNSANLHWALSGADTGRVNNLRLGESILLGCDPLHRKPIIGLHTDAITLVAEVIESKIKPSQPWGTIAQNAFGIPAPPKTNGPIQQAILALGRQDIDPSGLEAPHDIEILEASSDHLVVKTNGLSHPVGTEIAFQLNYSALLRAMTSPFISKLWKKRTATILPSRSPAEKARQLIPAYKESL
ncbi:alanine/ornithine racemase family PLP-dependent enzyme [Pontiellaceae bacterium B12219]|nr:alanine/ornithine racemase family PLP-dependent enzyme [Pontiellaceae bacterium B12219]